MPATSTGTGDAHVEKKKKKKGAGRDGGLVGRAGASLLKQSDKTRGKKGQRKHYRGLELLLKPADWEAGGLGRDGPSAYARTLLRVWAVAGQWPP